MTRAAARRRPSSPSAETADEYPQLRRLAVGPGERLVEQRLCGRIWPTWLRHSTPESSSWHAVAQAGVGGGDLQQPVVLGDPFAASRGAGLQVTAAGADREVSDEGVAGLPRPVGDELAVPGRTADRHRLKRLGDRADLVQLDQRRV